MAENMVKKQLESSEIQTGACRFCGQIYQFETDGRATEEQLDRWAEEKCDCGDAIVNRNRRTKADAAKDNMREMAGERYEEAAEVICGGIDLLVGLRAVKVTVNTGRGVKLSASVNSKGNIKTEITRTQKASQEA